MKLLKKICMSSLLLVSSSTFAAQATDLQIEKLMQVMNTKELLQSTLEQIRPQLDQQAYGIVQSIVKNKTLKPQEQIVANELADKIFEQSQKSMAWENMKPIYQKIYSNIYNAEEVQAQIDFYSSQIGQSILKKGPIIAKESMTIMNHRLLENLITSEKEMEDINKKLEALKKASNPN